MDDPYALLGLAPDCNDDTEIRTAYHDLVRRNQASPEVNAAYARIRTPADRFRYRWCEVTSLVGPVPAVTDHVVDLDTLIAELCSLSDWELGEPA